MTTPTPEQIELALGAYKDSDTYLNACLTHPVMPDVVLRQTLTAKDARIKELEEALLKIATTEHCIYDGNRPYVSEHSSGYALGVADGHRLAATWARTALATKE